ncbi:hypothetical protein HUT06_33865 [Actinomadura sp. NAK00032]|uniref:hypothetical protein n=1 Tax=Actinomadura sp. NAK00032 TaxID=2742128 RepID=UPI0015912923|nr:hypothetical protein [Actinomadura sp. NAK00032]QKW38385.1 hypothetical protein HUT06_33865 [Actinomadura sp. NAK00032]
MEVLEVRCAARRRPVATAPSLVCAVRTICSSVTRPSRRVAEAVRLGAGIGAAASSRPLALDE